MDPQRAAKLGIDPQEVKITCEAGKYSNKWILWIPNNRYPEDDPRHKQILTESRSREGIHELCHWKARLKECVHAA